MTGDSNLKSFIKTIAKVWSALNTPSSFRQSATSNGLSGASDKIAGVAHQDSLVE